MLREATGEMRITGVPAEFPQLIVTRPTMKLQAAFVERERRSREGRGSLMFHGTPIRNLLPILRDGFNGSGSRDPNRHPIVYNPRADMDRGVWLAMEPSFSVDFALKESLALTTIARRGG